jgi:glycosyltransferase involved in cell wall biosynthesis
MFDRAPRKILMTADAVGGVWTYALDLARALAPHGVEFLIATMGPRPNEVQRNEVACLENVTLVESDFRLEWMDEPWSEVDAAGAWLLTLATDFGADLIHLNGYAHAALRWNAPVLVVAHSCVVSWWRAVKGEEPPARFAEYRRRVAAGLAAADLVVAPTAAMRDSLAKSYGRTTRGVVVANGREPRLFAAVEKHPVISTVGRAWDEAKNVRALDAIAPQLPWPVWVAGAVEHPHGAPSALPNICPLGKLPPHEIAALLGVSAIFALPARYEPFGLSALEAGLSGCALVLGDIPSLREVWQDAAVFVAPEDQAALAEALRRLIDDEPNRKEMARRARARAEQFTLQRMATAYLSIYFSLANRSHQFGHAA